jgi:hypothetical protein
MTLAKTDRKRLTMKLNQQTYPGDSIAQSETVLGGIDVSAWELTASRAPVVRSSTTRKLPEFDLDFEAIQRQAQTARSAWVASRLKSYYEALLRKVRAESTNFSVASSVLKGVKNKAA